MNSSSDTQACTLRSASHRPGKEVFKVAAVISHPIQYFSPLFRQIAEHPSIDLTVYYTRDVGAREGYDKGFGVSYQWDTPVLEGHNYVLLSQGRSLEERIHREAAVRLWGALSGGRYDAVWLHGYMQPENWIAFMAAAYSRTPVLLRGESNLLDQRTKLRSTVKTAFLRPLVRQAAACMYIGTANRKYYKHYGARESQLVQMPYVVDNSFFSEWWARLLPRRNQIRQRFGINDDAPVILAAGKLVPKKAPLDVLHAFARVQTNVNCHLLFAGDGELRAVIERTIRDESIPNVHITGFLNQSEMPMAYAAANIQVLASRFQETWGLTINEGMNFHLPVIVSDRVGCSQDLVHHGLNGYIFPAGDVDMLAYHLQQAVTQPAQLQVMGEESAAIISKWGLPEAVDGLVSALRLTVTNRTST
ncbi:MAG: glycosyltransferase family 4 protein [Chloroflexota bacterium]|nr:glycosyltransferase family 4 protein [Chloroflexota bacterium]